MKGLDGTLCAYLLVALDELYEVMEIKFGFMDFICEII
jgi:hypothetical protein